MFVAFMRVMILFCIAHNFNVVYSMAEIHLSCAKEQTSSFAIIHFAIFWALHVCSSRSYCSVAAFFLFIFILCPTAFYDLLKSMPNVRYETEYFIIVCFIARFLPRTANFWNSNLSN